MIAWVPDPLSATHVSRGPVMILAVDEYERCLSVEEDGSLCWLKISEIKVDWRFDWKNGQWTDVSPFGGDNDGSEEADGRGPDISGDIPDADGADGSGEGDEGGSGQD